MSTEETGHPSPAADWTTTDPASAYRLPGRPLKAASVADIEREFGLALERLTGARYTVELAKLNFGEGFAAALFDNAEIALKVARQADATGV